MGLIGYVISLVIVGFVVGGLGRLVVPGPNRIGLWPTLGIGLVGAFLGGLLGAIIGAGIFSLIFEVAISAGLVYRVSGSSRRRLSPGRRR